MKRYAAHAARFLNERCEREKIYCDTKVTAIYIGWRGARVNESLLKRYFGATLGGYLGEFSAGATLFDRKPVSEQVAPGAISTLRVLETEALWPDALADDPKPGTPVNKMIVFGHSLGGNLFATGLQDDLVKLVRRHKPGERLPPVLGNLVVLLNPAAEATKWTAVQREVWDRIAYHKDSVTNIGVVQGDHEFFPRDQKPVVVSVTSALTFPAGGLREGDCEWIKLKVEDSFVTERANIRMPLKTKEGLFRDGIDYDWATHDLFPMFKFDFRPLALWLDSKSARIEERSSPADSCDEREPSFLHRLESAPIHALSKLAQNFPFQNTNQELSHTIGNLDPPRLAGGVLVNKRLVSAEPFGTTHELFGLDENHAEKHNPYKSLADTSIVCPSANHWLSRARSAQPPQGTNWDTRKLAQATDPVGEGAPAVQFLHGFNLAGQEPITRANDPFWNIRAFDNVLSPHDGYRLSSFICAMNELVMDDITQSPPPKLLRTAPGAIEPDVVKPNAVQPP